MLRNRHCHGYLDAMRLRRHMAQSQWTGIKSKQIVWLYPIRLSLQIFPTIPLLDYNPNRLTFGRCRPELPFSRFNPGDSLVDKHVPSLTVADATYRINSLIWIAAIRCNAAYLVCISHFCLLFEMAPQKA
jgi:hypothetical protein